VVHDETTSMAEAIVVDLPFSMLHHFGHRNVPGKSAVRLVIKFHYISNNTSNNSLHVIIDPYLITACRVSQQNRP
jgi:hypothetical protein